MMRFTLAARVPARAIVTICARFALTLGAGLLSLAAAAQTAAPVLPAELFFKPPEVIDAKLSPSGRRLAVTSNLAGGERVGLFVWDLAPEGTGTAPRVNRAAQFTDADVRSFYWVNDERLVFDVVDLSEGVQRYAPGLFAVRHDGEALRELVARHGRSFVSAPRMGRESLHLNHTLLAVPQIGGDEILIGELQGAGGQLLAVRPKWLSVTSGRARDAAAGGPSNATLWRFDSRGEARVAVADPFLVLEGSWWIDDDTSRDMRRYSLPRMIGDAEKDSEMLKAVSPVEQAAKIRAPLLLAYGERDRRVPLAHGERLLKALRAAGQPPLWVTYPDEGHVWIKPATRVDFARRVEGFLEQHLKPATK